MRALPWWSVWPDDFYDICTTLLAVESVQPYLDYKASTPDTIVLYD